MKYLRNLFLLLTLVLSLPSCQALGGLIPVIADIIGGIAQAKEAVDKIDQIAQTYFAVNPNVELQEKYAKAKGIVDNTLTGVLKVSQGAENAAQEDVDAAWDDFKEAYTALITVLADIGFRVQFDGENTFQAGGDEDKPLMAIPKPDDLRLD